MGVWSQIRKRISVENLLGQYGHLVLCSFRNPQPMHTDESIADMVRMLCKTVPPPGQQGVRYMSTVSNDQMTWLVWRSGNGVRHINEVKLRRAQLVLGLVTTFGGSVILIYIQATQAHSAWPSLCG